MKKILAAVAATVMLTLSIAPAADAGRPTQNRDSGWPCGGC